MPNYNGIIINAATIDGKCTVCRRPLDDEASLNLTFGFKTTTFCPQCVSDGLRSFPLLKAQGQSLSEAVQGLQKQIDALKKEKKNGKPKERKPTDTPAKGSKSAPVPKVSK